MDTEAVTAALRTARQRLAQLLKQGGDVAKPAGEILESLNRIEAAVFAEAISGGPVRHRRNKPKQYAVEEDGTGEALAEYRDDGRPPFRIPSQTYEAVIKVMGRITEPTQFDEILSSVNNELGEDVPDYQVRVCLRFLCSVDVGLVRRQRARYVPVRRSRFLREAKQCWSEARCT
jgi:hypothetical protein